MSSSVARIPLLLLLLLLLCLPPSSWTAETGDGTDTGATATTQSPSPPPAEGTGPAADNGRTGQEEDLQALRHRYRQDATGVRARLGMCRRGQGGPGGGPHHRYRGGESWPNP